MALTENAAATTLNVPSNFSIPQFLLDGVKHSTRPERLASTPCLVDDITGEQVFIDQLRARTQHLASAIQTNWNLNEGDIVSIMSFNHINFAPTVWATHRLGGIVATLSPTLSVGELVHHLTIARPALLFLHVDCLPAALEAASEILLPLDRIVILGSSSSTFASAQSISFPSFDDLIQQGRLLPPVIEKPFEEGEAKRRIAFLAPSSGTTGIQKAVSISHFNVISIIIQSAAFNRIGDEYAPWEDRRFRSGDVCCGFLPLYHIYGLVYNLHFMLYAGMTLVLAPKFHFENFLQSIERYQITHLTIVPPQAVLLCKHPAVKKYTLSSVRYCIVAAAPLSASLTSGLLAVLPNAHLGQGYGMTETCGTVSMFPLTQKVGTLGSGGQLLPGTVTKVVKEDGSLAQTGEVGELYVQGGQVALGYYGNEEATKQTFVDGWLRTGDQVYFKPNGDIFIVDRIKELIKVKGLQVAPAELEGHLLMHSQVADAAVIGVPDEYSGEVPLAFIVLQPRIASAVQHDERYADTVRKSIYKHVADEKSKHKRLSGGVIFTESIPRNASGKILRRILINVFRKQNVPPPLSPLVSMSQNEALASAKL